MNRGNCTLTVLDLSAFMLLQKAKIVYDTYYKLNIENVANKACFVTVTF